MNRISARIFLAVVLLSTSAVVASPTSADASSGPWSAPQTVHAADESLHDLDVAAGPRRYAVAAWISGTPQIVTAAGTSAEASDRRVWIAVRGAGQKRFRAPRAVSQAGARSLRLRISPNGHTVLTWVDDQQRLQAMFKEVPGRWSDPQTVAEHLSTGTSLAVGPDGTAIAGWRTGRSGEPDEALHVAVRAPGGRFAPPVTVASGPGIGGFGPVVAAARAGEGLAAWSGRCWLEDPASAHRDAAAANVSVQPFAPQQTFVGEVQSIPDTKCPTSDLHAVLRNDGSGLVVIDGLRGHLDALKASWRPPSGAFSQPVFISPEGLDAGGAVVRLRGAGEVIAAWTATETGEPRGVYGAIGRADGSFTPARRISGKRGSLQDAAFNRRGRGIVIWRGFGTSRLRSAVMKPGGWFRAPQRGPTSLSEGSVVVGVNRGRRATAAWSKPQPRSFPAGVFVANRRV